MNTSTFRSNLKTQLDARAGMVTLGAVVYRYPPGKQAVVTKPHLWFGAVTNVNPSDLTLAGSQQAEYLIEGGGYAYSAGSTDAQYATAETNAYTLVNELVDQLVDDATVNSACDHARVESWNITPATDDQGRVSMDIEFVVRVRQYSSA